MAQKKLKGKSTAKDKDGQHRKETKEERKLRLQRQQEAREVSFQGERIDQFVCFVVPYSLVFVSLTQPLAMLENSAVHSGGYRSHAPRVHAVREICACQTTEDESECYRGVHCRHGTDSLRRSTS
jgi:hypothetical protein